MSNEDLVRKMEYVLQRKLTPEEGKFLALANEVLKQKDSPSPKMSKSKAQVA